MADQPVNSPQDAAQQAFEKVLSREPFTGLKAILDNLSTDRNALREKVMAANSYEDLLTKLGYRITLIKQIHVQDAYSRTGPEGGIKAVLQYHDIPTQRSLPTLVNYDSSVVTTSKSSAFFNEMLAAFQKQWRALS